MKRTIFVLAALVAGLTADAARAEDIFMASPEIVEKYVAATWTKAPKDWVSRVEQDETQRVCSQYRNRPPGDLAEKLLEREKATVVFPADGNVMGDWKKGEAIAQSGFGGRFNDKPPVLDRKSVV